MGLLLGEVRRLIALQERFQVGGVSNHRRFLEGHGEILGVWFCVYSEHQFFNVPAEL